MKLTADRNTPLMEAGVIAVPVKGGAVIHAGSIVCVDARGFAVPGVNTAGFKFVGRAEHAVTAPQADGAVTVAVRRAVAFKWAADATVKPEHLMHPVFVLDDQTVAAAGDVQAGIVVRVDADGAWVE